MKIYIFSDAVCTWSFGEEKVLRILDYLYDDLEFENIMGGMISDYHDILPMNMKDQDSDETANQILRQIWTSGATIHKMPVRDEPPVLLSRENPSTNILDRYFVAVRDIDVKKSNKFLRLLREATIVDGVNTSELENIKEILEKVDIDYSEFLESFENSDKMFLEDRMKTFDRRFENFPNFMYVNEKGREFILKGYKSKEELIEFIEEHSDLERKELKKEDETVLDFIDRYKRVFMPELYELFDREFIDRSILKLSEEKKIKLNTLEHTVDRTVEILSLK